MAEDSARVPALLSQLRGEVSGLRELNTRRAGDIVDEIRSEGEILVRALEVVAQEPLTELNQFAILVVYYDEVTNARFYFAHASPSIATIIAGIIAVGRIIWEVISTFLQIIGILKELGVIDLLYEHWPDFRALVDKLRTFAGELSDAIGWGFDGVLHIMNAANAMVGLAGSFAGKNWTLTKIEFYNRVQAITQSAATYIDEIQANPAEWLSSFSESALGSNWNDADGFLKKVNVKFNDVNKFLDHALDQGGQALDELIALRQGMPALVGKYIPQKIWDSLEKYDHLINDEIKPLLDKVGKKLEDTLAKFEAAADRLNALEDATSRPGDLLLNIDDLDPAHRVVQEAGIDNAASREIGRGMSSDLAKLTPESNRLASVAAALASPPGEPVFLTLESPERHKAAGIVEEPRETWFVGDF